MKTPVSASIFLITLLTIHVSAASTKSSLAGAHVFKPFKLIVPDAECVLTNGPAANVAFGFPERGDNAALAFILGPVPAKHTPGQNHNKPYTGPGAYTHIGIVAKSNDGRTYRGFGRVTVNADEQTGEFNFIPDVASGPGANKKSPIMGKWDCGKKISDQ